MRYDGLLFNKQGETQPFSLIAKSPEELFAKLHKVEEDFPDPWTLAWLESDGSHWRCNDSGGLVASEDADEENHYLLVME